MDKATVIDALFNLREKFRAIGETHSDNFAANLADEGADLADDVIAKLKVDVRFGDGDAVPAVQE